MSCTHSMRAPGRSVVVARSGLLLATLQTLCGPYFRDTLALRCFAWYTFVIPMRLYASQGILWGLSCLFGRYRCSLCPSYCHWGLTWLHLGLNPWYLALLFAILAQLGGISVSSGVFSVQFCAIFARFSVASARLAADWCYLGPTYRNFGLTLLHLCSNLR